MDSSTSLGSLLLLPVPLPPCFGWVLRLSELRSPTLTSLASLNQRFEQQNFQYASLWPFSRILSVQFPIWQGHLKWEGDADFSKAFTQVPFLAF